MYVYSINICLFVCLFFGPQPSINSRKKSFLTGRKLTNRFFNPALTCTKVTNVELVTSEKNQILFFFLFFWFIRVW